MQRSGQGIVRRIPGQQRPTQLVQQFKLLLCQIFQPGPDLPESAVALHPRRDHHLVPGRNVHLPQLAALRCHQVLRPMQLPARAPATRLAARTLTSRETPPHERPFLLQRQEELPRVLLARTPQPLPKPTRLLAHAPGIAFLVYLVKHYLYQTWTLRTPRERPSRQVRGNSRPYGPVRNPWAGEGKSRRGAKEDAVGAAAGGAGHARSRAPARRLPLDTPRGGEGH